MYPPALVQLKGYPTSPHVDRPLSHIHAANNAQGEATSYKLTVIPRLRQSIEGKGLIDGHAGGQNWKKAQQNKSRGALSRQHISIRKAGPYVYAVHRSSRYLRSENPSMQTIVILSYYWEKVALVRALGGGFGLFAILATYKMDWDTRFDRVDILLLLLSESLRCNSALQLRLDRSNGLLSGNTPISGS